MKNTAFLKQQARSQKFLKNFLLLSGYPYPNQDALEMPDF
jgi:hypothetical protein